MKHDYIIKIIFQIIKFDRLKNQKLNINNFLIPVCLPMTAATSSSKNPSTDFLNASSFYRTTPTMSPSTLLLGRAREEELKLLYKDPSKYQTNSKGLILFRIISLFILVQMIYQFD